jgi:hypothetical protein
MVYIGNSDWYHASKVHSLHLSIIWYKLTLIFPIQAYVQAFKSKLFYPTKAPTFSLLSPHNKTSTAEMPTLHPPKKLYPGNDTIKTNIPDLLLAFSLLTHIKWSGLFV